MNLRLNLTIPKLLHNAKNVRAVEELYTLHAVAEALVFVRGRAAFQSQSTVRMRILPAPLQAVRPVRWLARETGGLRLWKISVRAPTTALHQSLFLKKYDILSSNYPANSPEYDFEKLKAFPDHSERSSNEGFISTSATVIREIT